MTKRKYCVPSEINCSIKNAKAYFIPRDKTSQTSYSLVAYLLEARTVLSTEKTWQILWSGGRFLCCLHWATCESGKSVFQVIKSFPGPYFWWSFKTWGPLNLASSLQLKQAWMFHSVCKHLVHPQSTWKKMLLGIAFWAAHLHSNCAFEESVMASFLFSESQSIKGNRRISPWEGDFLLISPNNALSDFCIFNEKQLQ